MHWVSTGFDRSQETGPDAPAFAGRTEPHAGMPMHREQVAVNRSDKHLNANGVYWRLLEKFRGRDSFTTYDHSPLTA